MMDEYSSRLANLGTIGSRHAINVVFGQNMASRVMVIFVSANAGWNAYYLHLSVSSFTNETMKMLMKISKKINKTFLKAQKNLINERFFVQRC